MSESQSWRKDGFDWSIPALLFVCSRLHRLIHDISDGKELILEGSCEALFDFRFV